MKKILILFACVFAALFGASAARAEGITITINGTELECDAPPRNVNDRVLVPVRAIFEALGADVSWDGDTHTVFAGKDGDIISLTIDSPQMDLSVYASDGDLVLTDSIILDVPAEVMDDRTFVPVRAVSEALKAKVRWDGDSQTVIITEPESEGLIYYSSAADGGRLYAVDSNGKNRRKILDKGVNTLRYYDDYIYCFMNDSGSVLYRVDQFTGAEQAVSEADIYELGADDERIYFVEGTSSPVYEGSLCSMNFDGTDKRILTDERVKFAEMHGDYIYYNVDGDNAMHILSKDGSFANTASVESDITLYPMNCMFISDRIFVENHAWYGIIVRFDAKGGDAVPINDTGAILCPEQAAGDTLLYIGMDDQDIYSVGIDGGNEHKLVDMDEDCFHTAILTQWEDRIYYKNYMRKEVYSINLDGSDGKYICYADDVKAVNGRLFIVLDGLYVSGLDGEDLLKIYDGEVKDYKVIGNSAYVRGKSSGRLYKSDLDGSFNSVTSDGADEWVCGYAE